MKDELDRIDLLFENERLAREAQNRDAVDEEGRDRVDKLFDEKRHPYLPDGLNPNDPRSYIVEALKRFPESAWGVGEDIVGGVKALVTDPVGVAQGAADVGGGAMEKLGRKFEEFVLDEEIPPTPGKEDAVNQVIEALDEDYGSPSRALRTLVTDPAGTMLDVGLIGGPKALRSLEPLGAIGRTAQRTTGAISDKLYKNAAGIPASTLDEGTDLARRSAREGASVDPDGLRFTKLMRDELNIELNDMITNTMEGVPLVDKRVIVNGFDELIEKQRNKPRASQNIEYIKRKRQEFLDEFPGQDELYPYQLHDWKTGAYVDAYQKAAKGKADRKVATLRTSARGAKEALENIPELENYGPTNARWQTFAEIEPYIAKRIDEIGQTDSVLKGIMERTVMSPGWQSNAAIFLRKAADADMGWMGRNMNTAEIRTALALVGRNQETLEFEDEPLQIEIQDGVAQ